jgi:hypothetical protein
LIIEERIRTVKRFDKFVRKKFDRAKCDPKHLTVENTNLEAGSGISG